MVSWVVGFDFCKDVAQTRRTFKAVWNGKRQALRLTCSVIRVLSKDDDFHVLRLQRLQCTKRRCGINHSILCEPLGKKG